LDDKTKESLQVVFRAREAKIKIGGSVDAGGGSGSGRGRAGGVNGGGGGGGANGDGVVRIVPVQRANNVAIMLSQCRMPHGVIRDAITGGNQKGVLSLERLDLLQQVIPNDDEVQQLQGYTGPVDALCAPEQFLLTLASIPRLRDKIEVLVFMLRFADLHKEARTIMATVTRACQQVHNSRALKACLKVALEYVNFLNHGTARGGAAGFNVESLPKLFDHKTTVTLPPPFPPSTPKPDSFLTPAHRPVPRSHSHTDSTQVKSPPGLQTAQDSSSLPTSSSLPIHQSASLPSLHNHPSASQPPPTTPLPAPALTPAAAVLSPRAMSPRAAAFSPKVIAMAAAAGDADALSSAILRASCLLEVVVLRLAASGAVTPPFEMSKELEAVGLAAKYSQDEIDSSLTPMDQGIGMVERELAFLIRDDEAAAAAEAEAKAAAEASAGAAAAAAAAAAAGGNALAEPPAGSESQEGIASRRRGSGGSGEGGEEDAVGELLSQQAAAVAAKQSLRIGAAERESSDSEMSSGSVATGAAASCAGTCFAKEKGRRRSMFGVPSRGRGAKKDKGKEMAGMVEKGQAKERGAKGQGKSRGAKSVVPHDDEVSSVLLLQLQVLVPRPLLLRLYLLPLLPPSTPPPPAPPRPPLPPPQQRQLGRQEATAGGRGAVCTSVSLVEGEVHQGASGKPRVEANDEATSIPLTAANSTNGKSTSTIAAASAVASPVLRGVAPAAEAAAASAPQLTFSASSNAPNASKANSEVAFTGRDSKEGSHSEAGRGGGKGRGGRGRGRGRGGGRGRGRAREGSGTRTVGRGADLVSIGPEARAEMAAGGAVGSGIGSSLEDLSSLRTQGGEKAPALGSRRLNPSASSSGRGPVKPMPILRLGSIHEQDENADPAPTPPTSAPPPLPSPLLPPPLSPAPLLNATATANQAPLSANLGSNVSSSRDINSTTAAASTPLSFPAPPVDCPRPELAVTPVQATTTPGLAFATPIVLPTQSRLMRAAGGSGPFRLMSELVDSSSSSSGSSSDGDEEEEGEEGGERRGLRADNGWQPLARGGGGGGAGGDGRKRSSRPTCVVYRRSPFDGAITPSPGTKRAWSDGNLLVRPDLLLRGSALKPGAADRGDGALRVARAGAAGGVGEKECGVGEDVGGGESSVTGPVRGEQVREEEGEVTQKRVCKDEEGTSEQQQQGPRECLRPLFGSCSARLEAASSSKLASMGRDGSSGVGCDGLGSRSSRSSRRASGRGVVRRHRKGSGGGAAAAAAFGGGAAGVRSSGRILPRTHSDPTQLESLAFHELLKGVGAARAACECGGNPCDCKGSHSKRRRSDGPFSLRALGTRSTSATETNCHTAAAAASAAASAATAVSLRLSAETVAERADAAAVAESAAGDAVTAGVASDSASATATATAKAATKPMQRLQVAQELERLLRSPPPGAAPVSSICSAPPGIQVMSRYGTDEVESGEEACSAMVGANGREGVGEGGERAEGGGMREVRASGRLRIRVPVREGCAVAGGGSAGEGDRREEGLERKGVRESETGDAAHAAASCDAVKEGREGGGDKAGGGSSSVAQQGREMTEAKNGAEGDVDGQEEQEGEEDCYEEWDEEWDEEEEEGEDGEDDPEERDDASSTEGRRELPLSEHLTAFLDKARPERDSLAEETARCREQLKALAKYFGSSATVTPQAVLGTIWQFAVLYDKSQRSSSLL
ncbi:hypothetical protein CLOP_g10271, partial [Closterium sp. NIES-67]